MKTKKKLLLTAVSLLTAASIVGAGTFAYFIDKDWTSDTLVAGTMTTDNNGITIGKSAVTNISSKNSATVSARNNFDSIRLATKTYGYHTSNNPAKYFVYTGSYDIVNGVCFNDNSGNVVYCTDHGLQATDASYTSDHISTGSIGTTKLTESSFISDDVKRVLQVGYPEKTAADYTLANNDDEVKWATAMAIYMAEGRAYNSDGSDNTGKVITSENITLDGKTGLITATGAAATDAQINAMLGGNANAEQIQAKRDEYINEATRLRELILDIYNASLLETAEEFTLDNSEVQTTERVDSKGNVTSYKVGPFKLNNNIGTCSISTTASGAMFEDQFGNKITTIKSSADIKEFYVILPPTFNTKNTVSITVSTTAKSYPMYYYWSGKATEQKMVVCNQNYKPSINATVGVGMYPDYKYWNPGDILNVMWKVTNNGSKSVITRNIVSIYWESNNFSAYANQNDIIFMYPQKINTDTIFTDIFNNVHPTLAGNSYKSLGNMSPIVVDGKTYNSGYQFILDGDSLDGLGIGSETSDAKEVNYNSEYDDSDAYSDTISFKLALSSFANIHTMGQNVIMKVETQSMQYRNTSDADWETMWDTDATMYYNLATGQIINK